MRWWLVLALLPACGSGGRTQPTYPPSEGGEHAGTAPSPSSGPSGYELTPVSERIVGGAPSGGDAGAAKQDAATPASTAADAAPAPPGPKDTTNPNENPKGPAGLPPTPARIDVDAGLGQVIGDASVGKPPGTPFGDGVSK